ncbi:TRAP transporter large permease [Clostridiaceae bacterium 35-E11]
MENVTLVLFGSLIIFFILNIPIAFSLGIASALTLVAASNVPLVVVPQRLFTATDSFPFMAVPFFILAGSLMESGGISRRLINFANTLIGFLSGGLALVSIVACMFFAAISGSSAATTAAIGSIMIPAMVKKKYDVGFSSAIQAAGGTIGVIIPPSIPLVTYGVLTGVSIGSLFIAGFGPGLLMTISLMGVAFFISKKEGYGGEKKANFSEITKAFKDAILALLMPGIILGGIYGGMFTPTEAAVVAVIYGFVIGFFVYKELTMKNLPTILTDAAVSTSVIMLLIATAALFGWILTNNQIPQQIAGLFLSISTSPIVILLLINILLLIVGTFLDTVAAIIILVPILFPIITQLGIDPLHFGLIIAVNLAVGMITPPFGVCLFVACGISKISLEEVVKNILPFLIILIIDILLITYVPSITTFLPKILM